MTQPTVEAKAAGSGLDASDARKLASYIIPAMLATLPALVMRFTGTRGTPALNALVFGIALLAAGFLLS